MAGGLKKEAAGGKACREFDILVLGGGFAGVYAAREAARRLRGRGECRIGLIASENHMVFQPMLPEVAGSELSPRHVVNPIRLLCRGVDVLKAEVRRIDLERGEVEIHAGDFSPNHFIRFRRLALALGAQVDLRKIPGMPEHALLMQNVGDAMKLRATLISRMEEANIELDPENRRRLLQVAVVGGGYSGVETAGQVVDLFDSIHRYYRNVGREDFHVRLIHSRDHLLPTMKESLAEYTRRKLEGRGVEVVLGRRVQSVTARQLTLDDGREFPATTVVSTVGNAPHPVVVSLCSEGELENRKGRVLTGPDCKVPAVDGLWAAGDCAAVPMPGTAGEYCPPTAQFAMRQGKLMGGNLAADFLGEAPAEFSFKGLGELAVIGHRSAVAHVLGFHFSGFLAWWMWRTIYLAKLPGFERKLRVMLDWTLDIFFPRDINLLTPRYTSPLSEVHLEMGDVLFRGGEPAFSFYIVKSGCIDIRDDAGELVKSVGQGGHFGERALLADGVWRFEAVAAEPTILVSIGSRVFHRVVDACGSIGKLFERTASTYQSHEEIAGMLEKVPASMRARTAGEVMTREVVSVESGMAVKRALALFREHPHSAYPILDAGGRLQGMLRRSVFYEWYTRQTVVGGTLADVPFASAPRVPPEMPLGEVFERMIRAGSTEVLVVEGGELLGILALVDLLDAR